MGIMKKLSILAQAAKYDRVCGKDNKGAIKAGTSNDINNFIFIAPATVEAMFRFKGPFH